MRRLISCTTTEEDMMSDIGTTLTSSCARCTFTHNRAHGQPRLHGPESLQFLGSVFLRLLFSIIAQLDSHWDRLVICSLCFAIRLPFPPPIVQQISLRDPSDSILFFFFFFCISFCDNLPIFLVCVWGRRQRIWWKESDSWQRSLFKQLTPFVLVQCGVISYAYLFMKRHYIVTFPASVMALAFTVIKTLWNIGFSTGYYFQSFYIGVVGDCKRLSLVSCFQWLWKKVELARFLVIWLKKVFRSVHKFHSSFSGLRLPQASISFFQAHFPSN